MATARGSCRAAVRCRAGITWASAIGSGLVDNIPFTAAMVPVVEQLQSGNGGDDALFALANTGVAFGGGVLTEAVSSRLAWAIVAGLVVGKLLGIAGATFLGLRLGWGALPQGVRRGQVWGLAALGGIGFTVLLFIGQLAYDDPAVVDTAKVGIFAGSLVSGLLGAALLLSGRPKLGRRPRA